jgi:hypothetical protein
MDELKNIVFDVVGEYVNPDCLTINSKGDHYWVISRVRIDDALQHMAQDDLDKRLAGTRFDDKVVLYWPVEK